MGNENQKNVNPIFKNYLQLKIETHDLIGQIIVVKSRQSNNIFSIKQYRYASEYDHQAAIKKMQRRKVLSNKKHANNIIKLVNIQNSVQDDVCGMTFFMYCIFQKIEITLQEQILERKFNCNQYREEQILRFIKCISSGILFMHDHNLRNYFLTKESIIANKDGNYKILDTEITTQLNPYAKIYNGIPIKKGVYLSPQLIEQLIIKNSDPDFSAKSNIFTLGIITLQICCKQELDNYYDYNKLILNLKDLKQKVYQMNYSLFLKQLILQMIQPVEDDRIGLLSLKQKLSPSDTKSITDYSQIHKSSFSKGNPTTKNSYLPVQYSQNPIYIQDLNINNNRNQREIFNLQSNQRETFSFQPSKRQTINLQPNQRQTINLQANQKKTINLQANQRQTLNIQPIQRKRIYSYENFLPKTSVSPMNKKDNIPIIQPKKYITTDRSSQSIPVGRYASKSFGKPKVNINFVKTVQLNNQNFQKQDFVNQINICSRPRPISNNNKKPSPINSIQSLFNTKPTTPVNNLQIFKNPTPINNLQVLEDYETPFKPNSVQINIGSTPIRKVQALQSNKQSPQKDYLNKNKLTSDFIIMNNNYGKHNFSNGAIYQGQFDNNKNFSGSGILYYPNNTICYSGSWLNNSFHGFGILYNEKNLLERIPTNYKNFTLNNNEAWQRYQGQFKMDKKDGFGTLYFHNGDKFSGCFCQDVVEGYGTFTSLLGQVVAGIWKDNILK